jgi:hypothetical protein
MSILTYNGQSIEQRDSDAMVNLTQMAQAKGVKVGDWTRLKSTEEYINALSSGMQIPVLDLLVVINGGSNGSGTWGHYLLAIEFGRWISPEFAIWCDKHIHRLVTTGRTELEENRQSLEVSIAPVPTLKEINQMARIYSRIYGKAYEQQYIDQKVQHYYPALKGKQADPSQLASLPTTKALLTPTQIGEAIGWYCKSNQAKGDARLVNAKLAELGYQESIGGKWSATDKAVSAGLVDRKPVDTNSRTQKDQLLWSAGILPILHEHSEVV